MTVVFIGHVLRVFVRAFLAEDWLAYFWGPNSASSHRAMPSCACRLELNCCNSTASSMAGYWLTLRTMR